MSRSRRSGLGFRREVAVFLPVAMLVVVLLGLATLFAYRTALDLLVDERRIEAEAAARRVARRIADEPRSALEALLRGETRALAVGLLDDRGQTLAEIGIPLEGPAPASGSEVRAGGIVAVAPIGDGRSLRLDLGLGVVGTLERGAQLLSWVVGTVDVAVVLLVLLFLRTLLTPYDQLLRAAREVAPEDEGEDEVAFLVRTFRQAIGALAAPPEDADEIAALERVLAPSVESGVLLLDVEGRVVALNPVGLHLLDLDPETTEVAGRQMSDLLASLPALVSVLGEALAGEAPVRRREVPVDSTSRTLGVTVHALRRGAESRGYLVLFADLTEARRQAEEERLNSSLTELGELAAGVAHELRNGLATIRGYLTLIERRPDPKRLPDDLGEIAREAEQLERVVSDFLDFARPSSARVAEVDLVRCLQRVAADPAFSEPGVETSFPGGPAWVSGDELLLEKALRNLVANGVEAHRSVGIGSSVTVRLAAGREGGWSVEIEDQGPGIPPDLRPRLFTPFVSGRAGGVGLGLSLARRIVLLHGGRLEIEDRPGGGTVARVALPGEAPAEGGATW